MGVVAVVLAAGSSSRLGRPKQTLLYEGETLLDRAVRIAREAAGDVIVVERGAGVPPARGTPALLVHNANPDEGIASSIRTGVAAAGADARILFTLCDQPRVTAEHLRALIAIDAPIVATGYSGIAGVPAIFAPRFVPELLALRGDRGARAIIERHRDEVHVIAFEDAAIDIDDARDVQKL